MTVLGFEPDDYRVPFEEEAHQDPTLEEITRIVCHDKIRPQLAENIGKNFSSETNFEPLDELFFREFLFRTLQSKILKWAKCPDLSRSAWPSVPRLELIHFDFVKHWPN